MALLGPDCLLWPPYWALLRGVAETARAEAWLTEMVALGLDEVPFRSRQSIATIEWIKDRMTAVGLSKFQVHSDNRFYGAALDGSHTEPDTRHTDAGGDPIATGYRCPVGLPGALAHMLAEEDLYCTAATSSGFEIATWHGDWEKWTGPREAINAAFIAACTKCGSLETYLTAQTAVVDASLALLRSYAPDVFTCFWYEYYKVPVGSGEVPIYAGYNRGPAALRTWLETFNLDGISPPNLSTMFQGGYVWLSPYRDVYHAQEGQWNYEEWEEMCVVLREFGARIAFSPWVSDGGGIPQWGMDADADAVIWEKLEVALGITSGAAPSGDAATNGSSQMATSFLTRTIARVRLFADEPSTSAKYTDAEILDMIESSIADVMGALNRASSSPIVVRHDIDFSNATTLEGSSYILPPNVGAILRLKKVSTTTGAVEWEILPRSRWNPSGPGVAFEGNMVVFEPYWDRGSYTLRIEYLPNGDVRLHEGTAGSITNDTDANTCTVVLDSSPSTGNLDLRPNAYAGSMFRFLVDSADSGFPVLERIIRSYDYSTRTVTLYPALPETPTGDVTYEIAPLLGQAFDMVAALDVAATILGIEGDAKRARSTQLQYSRKLASIRQNAAAMESIVGQRFEGDTAQAGYLDW